MPIFTSVHATNGEAKAHSYNAWATFGLSLATFVAWLLGAVSLAGASKYSWSIPTAVVLFVGAVLLSRSCLSRATILISNDGLAALIFGYQTRFIGWRDMTKIVKERLPVGGGYYSDTFIVYAGRRSFVCRPLLNICGNLVFDERIGGLRDLLDQINLHALEYAIPLFVWDLQTVAEQPPFVKRAGHRGKSELPVAKF
jgi:hypothetical protein